MSIEIIMLVLLAWWVISVPLYFVAALSAIGGHSAGFLLLLGAAPTLACVYAGAYIAEFLDKRKK